ncbi:GYDIA family GHMP kinase [uncultured Psychroserpens sp.]|uniref:GYDIA family GHMP kinase n=1 Tax=uncultured Psychroserpens sp. TaxID=255436 RepID=UPI00261B66DB|nr:GYDIA family GHMP kinase [uncultured Psychroserpens sp.]
MIKNYFGHGKLLLTGEYVILDGSLSLALPTTYGQHFTVEPIEGSRLVWQSIDDNSNIWFNTEFDLDQLKLTDQINDHDSVTKRLLQILRAAKMLQPEFLDTDQGYKVSTELEFPRNWGLGTSSTLIYAMSNWAKIDPYKLLELTFGGSGYDIACADANSAITYQLIDKHQRHITPVDFNPSFKSHLYFVHLNQKQDSRDGIAQYRAVTSAITAEISEISNITKQMLSCDSLETFQKLIEQHEHLISKLINQTPVKQKLFNDFSGSIKSLGAWGGDFILVASKTDPTDYFKEKGYKTLINYQSMVF